MDAVMHYYGCSMVPYGPYCSHTAHMVGDHIHQHTFASGRLGMGIRSWAEHVDAVWHLSRLQWPRICASATCIPVQGHTVPYCTIWYHWNEAPCCTILHPYCNYTLMASPNIRDVSKLSRNRLEMLAKSYVPVTVHTAPYGTIR